MNLRNQLSNQLCYDIWNYWNNQYDEEYYNEYMTEVGYSQITQQEHRLMSTRNTLL